MVFTRKILENGLTILHEKRSSPVTTIMLATKYGSMNDDLEEKGMAHFIEHLCFKGTKKRNSEDIAFAIEDVGGSFNAFTHEEITAYHIKIPSNRVELAIELLFDIFFNPSFPNEEIKKELRVIMEEIKSRRDNPHIYAYDQAKKLLYEKPFGLGGIGELNQIKNISRRKLIEKHHSMYTPKNSIFSIVGNPEIEEIIKMVNKNLVSRDFVNVKTPNIVKRVIPMKSEHRENLSQANLTLSCHFPSAKSSKRFSAELFCALLGNGMASKLFRKIRAEKGLVYGIRSDLDLGNDYGHLIIWAGTDTANMERVVNLCKDTFKRMKDITPEEFKRTKTRLIGNRKVNLENSEYVAAGLIFQEIVNNAEDFYSYEKKINSVSIEEIRELAKTSDFALFAIGP